MRAAVLLAAAFGWLAAAGWASFAHAALDGRVGVAGAVNPETDSLPPTGIYHPLIAGEDIAYKERIFTQEKGRAEILFLDRSSLSIGPNAEVVIDDFVYSPQDGKGRLSANVAKGLLRYIGGALSKNEDSVTFKTPSAVIGIRGGIALIEVTPEGLTRATFLYGQALTLTALNGETVQITRSGFTSEVGTDRTRPSPPVQAAVADLAAKITRLQSTGGGAAVQHLDLRTELGVQGFLSTAQIRQMLTSSTVPPALANVPPIMRPVLLQQFLDPDDILRKPRQPPPLAH